jgi:hypothetical protein
VYITLSASDIDDGDVLNYRVVDAPTGGVLSGSGENLTYTPDADFSGNDSFTFVANDGYFDSNIATISISVTSDVITITFAQYKTKAKQLVVEATSSLQPQAALTLIGYGEMTLNAAGGVYIYRAKAEDPGNTITVTSDLGGSTTALVSQK